VINTDHFVAGFYYIVSWSSFSPYRKARLRYHAGFAYPNLTVK